MAHSHRLASQVRAVDKTSGDEEAIKVDVHNDTSISFVSLEFPDRGRLVLPDLALFGQGSDLLQEFGFPCAEMMKPGLFEIALYKVRCVRVVLRVWM